MGSAQISTPYTLRNHRPGDIGWIIHRHGVLYNKEYDWDERFEALVAGVASDFIKNYDPQVERCWIAERYGEFLGSIMLVKDASKEDVAKTRLSLVEPTARGLGLGRALVRQCIQFAREVGYSRIGLWTQSSLVSARHIYAGEGFVHVESEDHDSFGIKLTGELWELQL
ncbi:acyl-CoA N-acyltransferase [Penicillium angulare]|uniref:acyl-CoA N-acyltransferase n=1 Tax=Penicillium angulare TaxID=116970 RepID=UPI0025400A66|nr:acyl-CoA N-acyltransferase [Penicillium angulare]KAJ5256962.1 acyl-CoA N-acyltransferase [Penicillium angulare]